MAQQVVNGADPAIRDKAHQLEMLGGAFRDTARKVLVAQPQPIAPGPGPQDACHLVELRVAGQAQQVEVKAVSAFM